MIVCWFAGRYSQSLQHYPSRVPLPTYNPAGRTNHGRHFFFVFRHCNWQHFVHGFNSIFCALFQSCALFQIKFAINTFQKNYGYTHSCSFVERSLWTTNPNFLKCSWEDRSAQIQLILFRLVPGFSLCDHAIRYDAVSLGLCQSALAFILSEFLCRFFSCFVVVTVIWGICFMFPFLFSSWFLSPFWLARQHGTPHCPLSSSTRDRLKRSKGLKML